MCNLIFFSHAFLVYGGDFSIHGGGLFGMFSTLDSVVNRHLDATIVSPEGRQKIDLTRSRYKMAVESLLAYPKTQRLHTFGKFLLCQQSNAIRLELTYSKDPSGGRPEDLVVITKVRVEEPC